MSGQAERDLNDVPVFLQVVRSGSFTGAAKFLGLPTSSVSRRMSRLEDRLGVKLLQRSTRKLSLTEAGQLYFERGEKIFGELIDVENRIADASARPTGRVRVAVPPEHTATVGLLPSFLERYPDVRVDMHFTPAGVNIIEQGYDVAIIPGEVTNLSVIAKKLMDSPFVLAASPSYLEERGTPASGDDLVDHDCIIFGPSSSAHLWRLQSGEREVEIQVKGRVAVDHMIAARELTVKGFGIGALPFVACRRELEAGDLIEVLPGWAPPSVPLWITYASGSFLPPAVRAYVDHVRESFEPTIQRGA